MSSLESDIEAARIRHFGPCPYHKGHEREGAAFCAGLLLGCFALVIVMSFEYVSWESWALKKGYATYLSDGKVHYQ